MTSRVTVEVFDPASTRVKCHAEYLTAFYSLFFTVYNATYNNSLTFLHTQSVGDHHV
jgi:hypothetical protein